MNRTVALFTERELDALPEKCWEYWMQWSSYNEILAFFQYALVDEMNKNDK